jgi:hypothetical protein
MEEIIAPTIAFLAGLWLWSSRFGTRPLARVLGAAISVGAGLIATILTGEYFASWVYLLADIGGGGAGVAVAMLAVRFVSVRRFHTASSVKNP